MENMGDWIIRNRVLVFVFGLVAVILLFSGGQFLTFSNDYRKFFSEDNPQLLDFENLQDTYAKADNILFMLEPADGNVFSKESLAVVSELTEEAWQIPYSIRVDSITNFQHTYAEGDDLTVQDMVEDIDGLTAEQLASIKSIVLSEPLLINRLVSPDGKYTGVNVTIEVPGINEQSEGPEAVAFTRKIVSEFEQRNPGVKIYTTGIVMMNNAFPEASQNDFKTLIPAAFLAIVLGLLLFYKSIMATLFTTIVIILSIMAAMGSAGWLGIALTPPSASAPIVILTLAVADCVHFLTNYLQQLRKGLEKNAAIKESLRINIHPIFLTSLTTAIGFLSLNFSDSPPFHDLGNITAMGVIYAFFLTVFWLPAVMSLLPMRLFRKQAQEYASWQPMASMLERHQRVFLVVGLLIVGTSIYMIPKNEVNDQYVQYFDESIEFRRHTDYVTDHLTGLYTIQFSMQTEESGGVNDPEFLASIDRFSDWLRTLPEVVHVNTLTDIMKRLNKNMHGDEVDYYILPKERDLSAQYLLLYEMSLPYGLDLNNQIDVDKSATRITATLQTTTTREFLDMEDRIYAWLEENLPQYSVAAASPSLMFSHLGMRNIESMLTGTTVALVLISVILIFALRSLKFGLISLVPNLFPAIIAFGLWSIIDGEVGLALSIVVGMTLGIVVDDTVHFLSKYLRARREKGLDAPAAVAYALDTVGRALVITTIVLAIGFSILAFSAFELNAGMGLLTSITIAIALFVDFFFLPPLLMALDKGRYETLKS